MPGFIRASESSRRVSSLVPFLIQIQQIHLKLMKLESKYFASVFFSFVNTKFSTIFIDRLNLMTIVITW